MDLRDLTAQPELPAPAPFAPEMTCPERVVDAWWDDPEPECADRWYDDASYARYQTEMGDDDYCEPDAFAEVGALCWSAMRDASDLCAKAAYHVQGGAERVPF